MPTSSQRNDHLGAGAATDPVALHRLDVLGPVDRHEVVEQAVGVVGDPEEPLLELADLDDMTAALAATVDHLLVGEHRLVVGTPVDRRLLAVGQAALVERQEDPLGPAVVLGLVRGQLARPVDRDPPRVERAPEGGDRRIGGVARMLAGVDRMVLGRQPERVVAHRVQDPVAGAPVKVRDRIAQRVVLQVPDVRLAAGVRQHLEHVGLRALVRARGLVGDLPSPLARPQLLPLGLDSLGVISLVRHTFMRLLARLRRCLACPHVLPHVLTLLADTRVSRGYSSAGRAPEWHSGGRRFEPG